MLDEDQKCECEGCCLRTPCCHLCQVNGYEQTGWPDAVMFLGLCAMPVGMLLATAYWFKE